MTEAPTATPIARFNYIRLYNDSIFASAGNEYEPNWTSKQSPQSSRPPIVALADLASLFADASKGTIVTGSIGADIMTGYLRSPVRIRIPAGKLQMSVEDRHFLIAAGSANVITFTNDTFIQDPLTGEDKIDRKRVRSP